MASRGCIAAYGSSQSPPKYVRAVRDGAISTEIRTERDGFVLESIRYGDARKELADALNWRFMTQPLAPFSLFLAVVRNPRVARADVATRADVREGRGAMLVLGVVHAGFSLLLHLAGHAPRMGIPKLGRESHYLWQAIFVVPLYLLLYWIGGLAAHFVARRLSGSGSRDASIAVFGVAYAVPMTLVFLVPDVVVFFTLGFAAIGKAMRFYAPLMVLGCSWLAAVGLSRAHRMGTGRAAIAAFSGFVAQALVGGVFLR